MPKPPKPQIHTRKRKPPSGADHAGSRPRRPNSEETRAANLTKRLDTALPRPPTEPPIQRETLRTWSSQGEQPLAESLRKQTLQKGSNAKSPAGNETGPQDPAPGKRAYSHHTDQPAGGHGQRTRQSQVTHQEATWVPPRDDTRMRTSKTHRGGAPCAQDVQSFARPEQAITHQKKKKPPKTKSRSPGRTRPGRN